MLANTEGIAETTSNTSIKRETTGKTKTNENKINLTRRLITPQKNGYPTLIRKENIMKWAVKLH